jgi:hypothetical protein
MNGRLTQAESRLRSLIDIIHFTEQVSTRIHGEHTEAGIYRVLKQEFERSRRYQMSIAATTGNRDILTIVETVQRPGMLSLAQRRTGIRLSSFRIDLRKSSVYRAVISEGRTCHARTEDLVSEMVPAPVAALAIKILGFEGEGSVVTPLYRAGRIVGAFAMTSVVEANGSSALEPWTSSGGSRSWSRRHTMPFFSRT